MSTLQDTFLIEAYLDAVAYRLDPDFIDLLFREIVRRGLIVKMASPRRQLGQSS